MECILNNVISRFEKFALPTIAPFDYVGLLVGDRNKKVKKIGLTLDFSLLAMEKAVNLGCDALITHHGPLKFDLPVQGNMAKKIEFCNKNNLAVYRGHLNLDFCRGGIIDTLCDLLRIPAKQTTLKYEEFLITNGVKLADYSLTLEELIKRAKRLKPKTLRLAGPIKKRFKRIAITSGKGFFETFFGQLKPDLYIAGEFEQEAVRSAEDMGITLLELTHHASEARPLEIIAKKLNNILKVEVVFIETPDSIRNVI